MSLLESATETDGNVKVGRSKEPLVDDIWLFLNLPLLTKKYREIRQLLMEYFSKSFAQVFKLFHYKVNVKLVPHILADQVFFFKEKLSEHFLRSQHLCRSTIYSCVITMVTWGTWLARWDISTWLAMQHSDVTWSGLEINHLHWIVQTLQCKDFTMFLHFQYILTNPMWIENKWDPLIFWKI